MKNLFTILFVSMSFLFISCDNEVDLNAEYEDTTVIYALINAYQDTQFVKINRAFLQDGVNAIELAGDENNLFYENLDVKIIQPDDRDTFQLETISKPKDPGVFSSAKNVVHFINDKPFQGIQIDPGKRYDLYVTQSDGKVTSASVTTLGRAQILRPEARPNSGRVVSFVRNIGGLQYQDYQFIFGLNSDMSLAEIKLIFKFDEIVNGNPQPRTIEIPIGGVSNPNLEDNLDVPLEYNGELFYRKVAELAPQNGNRKIVQLVGNLDIEVTAVDALYRQYTFIYGPLDGLAQVRPEFTNVNNGIGLVASRSTSVANAHISDDSFRELQTGRYTRDLNFTRP